jgi:hypothetical protein
MKPFALRRWRNLGLLAVVSGIVLFLDAVLSVSLLDTHFYTGWLLAAALVVLASYNLYKKVPFLPLGRSALWLQIHIYLGLLTVLIFALHAGLHWPDGPLGWALSVLFAGVVGSGLFGLFISRMYPAQLRVRGPEVIFDQIPVLRKHLREQAERLILEEATELHTTYVADFYLERLKRFFDGPRNFWHHVLHAPGQRHDLLMEIDAQGRYLNDKEREVMHALRDLVERKDDLDFQVALQTAFKYWLFLHIPLTYSLLIFSAFHVLVVYAYSGVPW